jgi:hypothetical protein
MGRYGRPRTTGGTWTQLGQVPSALAIDIRRVAGTPTTYVASIGDGCAGVEVSSVKKGTRNVLGCAETATPPTPGRVAVSAPTVDAGWLLVGTQTFRSTAGLKSWSAV